MCGLVGMAGNIGPKSEKAMKILLILDALRGTDSTGVACVTRNNEVRVAKQIGNPYELIDTPSWNRAMQGWHKVFIGHNRYATQGGVNKKNAHPFDFETLVGAHNGTLHNKGALDDAAHFQVDSENLYHDIEVNDLKTTIAKIRGAWALTWWDKVDSTINFLRNKERPLFYVFNKEEDVIYWASELWMLEVALSRAEITYGDIHLFETDQHYCIEMLDGVKLGAINKTEVKGAPEYQYNNNHHNNGVIVYGGQNIRGGNSTNSQQQQSEVKALGKPTGMPSKNNGVAPQTAKVVQITKEVIERLKPGGDPYSLSKKVKLNTLGELVDANGSKYLACRDLEHPDKDIRLYLKTEDHGKWCYRKIIADIGKLFVSPINGFYYKVEYNGWQLNVLEEAMDETAKYQGADGNFLTKKEWEEIYHQCGWCSANTFAEDHKKVKFTMNNDVICPDCAVDQELGQYVQFR